MSTAIHWDCSLLALMASDFYWVWASTAALTAALASSLLLNDLSYSLAAASEALLAAILELPLIFEATFDFTDATR